MGPTQIPQIAGKGGGRGTGGHHTKMAYEFCRTRLARRIWAIKGRGGPDIPVWPRRPTRRNKGKIPLFIVGVDAVKDAIYARLRLTEPGPGAIHFPRRLDAEYFRQLTAGASSPASHAAAPSVPGSPSATASATRRWIPSSRTRTHKTASIVLSML